MVLSPRAEPSRRYSFTVPGAGFNTVSYSAISPDGRWIAYSPNVHAAPFRLYLRALAGFEEREVTSGPLTGFNPFFSADGQWLAFFGETALYRAPVSGGVPERVASVHPGTAEGAWADDGTIVVSANYPIDNVLRRPLTRLAPNAAFEALTRPGPGESHHDPDILPGSTTVLFTLVTPQTSSIVAVPLAGGEPRPVLAGARRPRYTRSGYLMFQRPSSGDLMSVPFDPDSLATSGEPIRIASAAHVVDSPAFDVARDGTIIYSEPGDTILQADFNVVAVDRMGAETQIVAEMRSWAEPRVSPDGRTLLLRDIVSPNCDLWTVDLHRGTRTRATFEGDNHNPIWRPDGQMTWGSQVTGVRTIRIGRPGRPDRVEQLAEADRERVPASWSPDGTQLAFIEIHPVTGDDIWLLSMDSGAARPFASSGYSEHQARFSPDGRWLAYVPNESGRDEVYIQPVDGDGGRLQVSVDSGHSPLWASEGRELFYVERSRLMGVSVVLGQGPPDISRPRTLVEGPYVWERLGNYDVTPDGTRFVFIRRTADADPSATLRVLLNWLTPR